MQGTPPHISVPLNNFRREQSKIKTGNIFLVRKWWNFTKGNSHVDEVAEVGAAGDRKPSFVFSCATESLGEPGAGAYRPTHIQIQEHRVIKTTHWEGPWEPDCLYKDDWKLLLLKNGCVLSLSQPPNLFSHLQRSEPLCIFFYKINCTNVNYYL